MSDPCPVGLRGIISALNTAFDAKDHVDLAAMRRQVDFLVEAGCVGALVPAVAAEVGSLRADERRAIVDTVLDHAGDRLPTIVGLSGLDPAERSHVIRAVTAAGAAGVLYNPPEEERGDALEGVLSEIAAAGAEFIMLQDLDWSGGGLDIDLIVRLFERIPAFKALKVETVPAGAKYRRALAETGGQLHVSGGWAAGQMMEGLQYGVHAFMPCGMERIYCTVFDRHQNGDAEGARAMFERLLPVIAFANQHIHVSIRFKKMLRVADGVFGSDLCRPPVPPFDAVQTAEAHRMIARAQELDEECRA